jgi:hypothetical protein
MVDITGNLVSKSIPHPQEKVAVHVQDYFANNYSIELSREIEKEQERVKKEQDL